MPLHVFQNPYGSVVIAESQEEAIELAKKYLTSQGKRPVGRVVKYDRVPDTKQLVVFDRFTQRFIAVRAVDCARRLGKGVPHADGQ